MPSLRAIIFLALCARALAQIPAFPGAEGYGAYALGGRNGDVYHVTNLNASGAGSFADAIATVPGAGRTIVFDVSGYIRFPSGSNGTRLTASKVTIAGQTAPGDGIGFYNNFFRISGDDIVIRHVRFRHGKYGSGGDCVDLDSGCLNAILDHVSMQFSTDENMSSYGSPPENVTLQYSLNAWGLETHSCGGLWDQNHATSHHNLWAHNHTRNPKARPSGLLEWINNVTFDWDIGFIMGDSTSVQNWKANVIGNYFICPPGNLRSKALEKASLATNGQPNFTVHLSSNLTDNDGDGLLNGTDKGYTIVSGSSYNQSASAIAGSTAGVATDNALVAYKKIVSNAGALRLDAGSAGALRDEVDTILVGKLTSRTPFHVTRESDTGASASGFGTLASAAAPVDTDKDGMPDYYETALAWNVATDDHTTALASSGGFITGTTFLPAGTVAGYTRLEEYLHFLAIPHGTVAKNIIGSPTSLEVDLRKFTSGFSSSPTFTVANVVGGGIAQSGPGDAIATFTPTLDYTGRARFEFTVTDSQGSTWTQTLAIVVTNSGLPRDLVWNGAGNSWDTTSATNWLRPSSGSTVTYSDGDRVAFDQSGLTQPGVSITGALAPTTVEVNGTGNYTLGGAGSVNSAGTLTKRGSGTLTLSHAETYAGGTSLEAGTLAIASPGSLAGGTIAMLDGTVLTNAYPTGTTSTLTPVIDIPAGNAATINSGNRFSLNGALTGAGTLNYNVQTTVSRADLKGATAAFSGRINFTNSGGVRLFFNGGSFNGFDDASVDVGGSVSLQPQTNSGGNTCNIAALSSASASANLAGGTAGAVAYVVGSNGNSTTFAGAITGNAALAKTGAGTLTLGGANTYTGATNVNGGSLVVSDSLGASAVTVASGASIAGGGTFSGGVTLQTGATVVAGTDASTRGPLTAAGGFAATSSTLAFDLSNSPTGANDKISVTGGTGYLAGANNFTINFADGTLGAGSYKLVDCAAGIPLDVAGGMTMNLTISAPAGGRQTYALNRTAAGTVGGYVQLVVTGSPATLTWTGAASGAWDTTSANWTGASPATFFPFDAVIFDDTATTTTITPGSSVAPRTTLVNNSTKAFTIAAGLDGGSLTKSGTNTLTLSGANAFAGGSALNGGTLQLGNDTANTSGLGSGPISFNGGTLKMSDNDSTYNDSTWNLVVAGGQSGTLWQDSRSTISGSLSGGGAFTLRAPWIRNDWFCDCSAFTGTMTVITDGSGGDFRFGTSYSWSGLPNASLFLNGPVSAYYIGISSAGAGTTIPIGELSGTSDSRLMGGATSGRNFTYVIGARTSPGNEAVFAGAISEQSSGVTTAFVKTGAGTWTLSGACAWNGGTTVEQGTLKISGSVVCGGGVNVQAGGTLSLAGGSLASDAVNIAANAALTGSGTINGDLNNDGTVTCGAGAITITGDVVNNGTMRFTGGSAISATAGFVNNGVLDLLTGGALPANLVNNGVVIANTERRVMSASKSGANFTVTVQGHAGHNYQLQSTDSLGGTWVDVGSAQAGTGGVLTLTDTGGATGTQRFYRVTVLP
ncbi:MAG: autotransporter-associated beta strand repeat-containing protein [Chthoniobacteraceae bacterium]